MTAQELLIQLVNLHVKLWLDGDHLRYSAPPGALTPELRAALLEHKTEIMTHLQSPVTHAGQGIISGEMPLVPIVMFSYAHVAPQSWWKLLEELVEISPDLGPDKLSAVVQHLVAHHDGLRLRLVQKNNEYQMFIALTDDAVFSKENISHLSVAEQDEFIEAAVEKHWACLNLSNGPLLRLVYFDLGPQRLHRMLLILHHFAADAYSVQILLDDFRTACQKLLVGELIELPSKTNSYKDWAEEMYAYMCSEDVKPEIAYWKSLPWEKVKPTPVDYPNVVMSTRASLSGVLNEDETHILLSKAPASYHAQILDLLLTACVVAFARCAGLQPLLIMAFHHGRNSISESFDFSRTVGNFYTSYPLLLDVTLDMDSSHPAEVLKHVIAQRERLPHSGTTWPWVSYYTNEPVIGWQDNIKIVKNVIINYLGNLTTGVQPEMGLFGRISKPSQEETGLRAYDVRAMTPHDCVIFIEYGQLKINWQYYPNIHKESTIENLLEEYLRVLRLFIGACEGAL